MSEFESIFEVSSDGDTLVLTPTSDLSELDFSLLNDSTELALERWKAEGKRNLIIDFRNTTYFGSTALGLFTRFWKRTCQANGKMAFCNLNENEREVLSVTRMDSLWPIVDTLEDAKRVVVGDTD